MDSLTTEGTYKEGFFHAVLVGVGGYFCWRALKAYPSKRSRAGQRRYNPRRSR
jgi:hypothetical protein